MQQALRTTALIVLWCTACTKPDTSSTDARLVEAQKDFEEGHRLQATGKYAAAVPFLESALELRRDILGHSHPEVAECLFLLGETYLAKGNDDLARILLWEGLDVWEAALDNNPALVATSLERVDLLPLYYEEHWEREIRKTTCGRRLETHSLYRRLLAIQEAALGKDHLLVAVSLTQLASDFTSRYHRGASPLLQRALAIQETALGKAPLHAAVSPTHLDNDSVDEDHYTSVEKLLQRMLTAREATLGKDHLLVAQSLEILADLYANQGIYARAEPLYERALAISEATLGKDHPHVADTLKYLATFYVEQGLHDRAEPLYERALAISEATLGRDHPHVADCLNTLANLYRRQGFFARARPLYERALAIQEAAGGKDNPDVAIPLEGLADLYRQQGLFARAKPLYARARSVQEAVSKSTSITLNSLADFYTDQGQYLEAELYYEIDLSRSRSTLGKRHPGVVSTLNKLARIRLAQAHLNEALPLLVEAFSISEQHLRQEVYGFSEARLADLLLQLRSEEELLYSLAATHPQDARIRQLALSAALLRKGRSAEEVSSTSRIIYRSLGQNDRETFERLRALRTELSTLSLAGPGPLPPEVYQQRLEQLATQGHALEADLARRSAPLRSLYELPDFHDLGVGTSDNNLERLMAVLVGSLRASHGRPPSESADFLPFGPNLFVAAALPDDGALVEFVAYDDKPLVPKPGGPASQSSSQARYLALLLFANGSTQALDLGPAEPINRAALRFHHALAGRSTSYRPAAQELHRLIFRPLVSLLGKRRRLFLSPDGQLSLIPFAALHDGSQFLVDNWDITYLNSGKELLHRPDELPPARSVVVLADPDFGSASMEPPAALRSAPVSWERVAALDRFFSSLRADLADRPWPPLPGSRREAEAIHRLLPGAQLLLGSSATKEALLKLPTPGILHIATHGFFLEDATVPQATRAVGHFGAIGETGSLQRPSDPLLRSGLVLAGAHTSEAHPGSRRPEDSLVTALELAGLDLWGTQLVVLSACDTGLGDVKLGQGVYGMRRALAVAGAQTLVTSLWKINDSVTSELMEAYYRHLLAGQGRTTALRRAMQALRHKQPHPHFWAPFIALGIDAPLREPGPR